VVRLNGPNDEAGTASRTALVDKLLLTPMVAAEALGIGRSKLYELLATGRLPSVRLDGCRRIATADLAELVDRLHDADNKN
jgi:excisionase family DNA binding protein